jgi:hypothetical protein
VVISRTKNEIMAMATKAQANLIHPPM